MALEPTVCKRGGFTESLVTQRVEVKTSRTVAQAKRQIKASAIE